MEDLSEKVVSGRRVVQSTTPARAAGRRIVASLILIVVTAGGCLARSPRSLPEAEAEAVRIDPGEALVVRLRFGAEADLDLHVTDPMKETVYFGNNPSLGGGVLEADRRCEDDAPRIEVVRFPEPRPGGYRVGVDYIDRCARTRKAVPFEVEVLYRGRSEVRRGEVPPARFLHDFWEFDLEALARGAAED